MEPSTEVQEIKATPDLIQMFVALMQQMSADNRETTLAAIAEMRKLSPEDQAKADAERDVRLAQSQRRMEAARIVAEDTAARQSGCRHLMRNGETNLRGQVNSDGFARVFCSLCNFTSLPFKATDVEVNQSGLNIDQWGPAAFTYVQSRIASTIASGERPAGAPRVPAGATILFD